MKKNILFILIFAFIGNMIYAQNNPQGRKVVTEKKVVVDEKVSKDRVNNMTTTGKNIDNNKDNQDKQLNKKSTAQSVEPTATALEAFNKKYPSVTNEKWSSDRYGFKAQFFENEIFNSAIFDNDGNWIETESTIFFEETPTAVQTAFNKDFEGFTANKTMKVENPKDGEIYVFYITGGDKYTEAKYTAEGKIINKQAYLIKKQTRSISK